MSDRPGTWGWWQANDGKWYPPELHPEFAPEADDTSPPAGQRRDFAGYVVAAVLILGAIGFGAFLIVRSRSESTHGIAGALTVRSLSQQGPVGRSCDGSLIANGYADMQQGADVVVKNQTGAVIASSHLGLGTFTEGGTACRMPFDVLRVPGATFYRIEVGNRSGVTESSAELASAGWKTELSLGP